ncbi:Putative aminopeptidase [Echinococcus granulosus]|uniref:Aminopeptidase n=1 Tax=Echinococcus granulosus TaxID=6210 RepID=W6UMC6_ECHGR|nr:Putative aminopeptidase [Echinococcus granulosus]EUB54644.1 Putative aminopeptidase [Echinococcus granulosus]
MFQDVLSGSLILKYQGVERHKGAVEDLAYNGGSTADTTFFLICKGITYDRGDIDAKVSMHGDKSGAAAVAGFYWTLSPLKPKGLSLPDKKMDLVK